MKELTLDEKRYVHAHLKRWFVEQREAVRNLDSHEKEGILYFCLDLATDFKRRYSPVEEDAVEKQGRF